MSSSKTETATYLVLSQAPHSALFSNPQATRDAGAEVQDSQMVLMLASWVGAGSTVSMETRAFHFYYVDDATSAKKTKTRRGERRSEKEKSATWISSRQVPSIVPRGDEKGEAERSRKKQKSFPRETKRRSLFYT